MPVCHLDPHFWPRCIGKIFSSVRIVLLLIVLSSCFFDCCPPLIFGFVGSTSIVERVGTSKRLRVPSGLGEEAIYRQIRIFEVHRHVDARPDKCGRSKRNA